MKFMTTISVLIVALFMAGTSTPCLAAAPKSAGKVSKSTASKQKTAQELPMHLIRDPFWPIGWAPKDWGKDMDEVKKITGLRKWSSAAAKIKLTGISKSRGKYFAVIKGQGLKEKGDIISVTHMGLVYRWTIKDITVHGIVPEKLDVTPAK